MCSLRNCIPRVVLSAEPEGAALQHINFHNPASITEEKEKGSCQRCGLKPSVSWHALVWDGWYAVRMYKPWPKTKYVLRIKVGIKFRARLGVLVQELAQNGAHYCFQ